jgi:hypothetical protein
MEINPVYCGCNIAAAKKEAQEEQQSQFLTHRYRSIDDGTIKSDLQIYNSAPSRN